MSNTKQRRRLTSGVFVRHSRGEIEFVHTDRTTRTVKLTDKRLATLKSLPGFVATQIGQDVYIGPIVDEVDDDDALYAWIDRLDYGWFE